MYAKSWVPGTYPLLDNLFNELREKRFLNTTHRLHKNYNKTHFKNISLLTISFDHNNNPKFCSSVISKDCWPKQVYRILNRLWKIDLQQGPLKSLSEEGRIMMYSQIKWLTEHSDCKLYFVSREGNHWQNFVVDQYNNNYKLNFKYNNYKYQTCTTPNDESCWQKIIYSGDDSFLQEWNKK